MLTRHRGDLRILSSDELNQLLARQLLEPRHTKITPAPTRKIPSDTPKPSSHRQPHQRRNHYTPRNG